MLGACDQLTLGHQQEPWAADVYQEKWISVCSSRESRVLAARVWLALALSFLGEIGREMLNVSRFLQSGLHTFSMRPPSFLRDAGSMPPSARFVGGQMGSNTCNKAPFDAHATCVIKHLQWIICRNAVDWRYCVCLRPMQQLTVAEDDLFHHVELGRPGHKRDPLAIRAGVEVCILISQWSNWRT